MYRLQILAPPSIPLLIVLYRDFGKNGKHLVSYAYSKHRNLCQKNSNPDGFIFSENGTKKIRKSKKLGEKKTRKAKHILVFTKSKV